MENTQKQTSEVVEEVKNKLQNIQRVHGIEQIFNIDSPHHLRFEVLFQSLTGYQMKHIDLQRMEILSIEAEYITPATVGIKVLIEIDKTDLTFGDIDTGLRYNGGA